MSKFLNNLLLVFNLILFYFSTSTLANLIQNSQLTSHDLLYHLQQQQQQQQPLYSSFNHQISQDNLKANLPTHLEKDDSSLFKSSVSSSSPTPSSTSSLSSSVLSSILNGQLPLDEQDAYKLLQHLKSSSSEDFNHQSSLPSSSASNANSPSPLSPSSPLPLSSLLSSSSSPLSSTSSTSTTTSAPSLQSSSITSSSTSPSFNSFISSIFPTLWAANNNLNAQQSPYKNDDSLRSKILPPIYIQPVIIPYPLVMNSMQNFMSDYTSRFMMSGYSNDPSSLSSSAAAAAATPTMNSFADEYEKDTMGRGNVRRSGISSYTNSPIYYVRLPSPTPITLYPTISYPGSTNAAASRPTRTFNSNPYHNPFAIQINPPQSIQTIAAYSSQPLSSQPASNMLPTLSPILNLPISFISNGKPNGIYQLTTSDNSLGSNTVSSSGEDSGSIQFTYHPHHHPQRIPAHHYSQSSSINPFVAAHQSDTSTNSNAFYRPSIIRPHSYPNYQHLNNGIVGGSVGNSDSKITNLKRQYFFNGRPEEIYVLSQPASSDNQYQFQHSIYPTFQSSQNDYY